MVRAKGGAASEAPDLKVLTDEAVVDGCAEEEEEPVEEAVALGLTEYEAAISGCDVDPDERVSECTETDNWEAAMETFQVCGLSDAASVRRAKLRRKREDTTEEGIRQADVSAAGLASPSSGRVEEGPHLQGV